MPRNTFVAGEVLTAAEMNSVADQTVMTFAGTAARGSAIASPSEGMFTFITDTDALEYYDGSDWVEFSPTPETPGDNLLYNGAMQVTQRGTSETGISSSGYFTADRWGLGNNVATITQTIEADGPTGSGFTKSLKNEVTTSGTPTGTQQFYLRQKLEGQDLQGLKKGTSSAESLTLSFWVKSNVTGTYIVNFRDVDNSRQISASYSVVASGTWEQKSITFAGDTSGALTNDNGSSLEMYFFLAAGPDRQSGTLATSWAAYADANQAVGQTNVAASTSNYWQITGVQLEAGEVASPFEHKSYGVELAECQRYFERIDGVKPIVNGAYYNSTSFQAVYKFPVEKRAAVSASVGDQTDYIVVRTGATSATTAFTFSDSNADSVRIVATTGSSTAGHGGYLKQNASDAFINIDAEL